MPLPQYLTSLTLAVWQSRWLRHCWMLLASLLSLWLLWTLSTEQLPVLQIHDTRSFECQTDTSDTDLPRFRIQTIQYMGAEALANNLCQADVMARYYRGVEIVWQQRGELSARHIVEEHYDLFWNRDRRVQGLVPNFNQYYDTLLELPNYRVLWFSQTETPQLTSGYFAARKLGLLEDMESNSHFLLPLNQLKQLGVDVATLDITYYASYRLLEDAFWRGEIDLISDGQWLEDKAGDRRLFSTLIDDASSMGSWYARSSRPRAIDCRVGKALLATMPGLHNLVPVRDQGACR